MGIVRLAAGDRVLDLGGSVAANFEFLSSFAHHLRVADLLDGEATAASAVAPRIDPTWGPFDLVLAWDVLTYLEPDDAATVVASLAAVCAPGACIFALVTITDEAAARSLTFVVRDEGTLEYRPAAPRPRPVGKWKPAAVQRLLAPFRVERSFVLRNGHQEYVAVLE